MRLGSIAPRRALPAPQRALNPRRGQSGSSRDHSSHARTTVWTSFGSDSGSSRSRLRGRPAARRTHEILEHRSRFEERHEQRGLRAHPLVLLRRLSNDLKDLVPGRLLEDHELGLRQEHSQEAASLETGVRRAPGRPRKRRHRPPAGRRCTRAAPAPATALHRGEQRVGSDRPRPPARRVL
jgi:hypothetical protein